MEVDRWWRTTALFGSLPESRQPWSGTGSPLRPFEADLVELDDEVRLYAELPGIRPGDLDLMFQRGILTLRGEKKDPRGTEERRGRYHLLERRSGRFTRSFTMPVAVDPDGIEATFDHGVLTVRLPRAEGGRPRRIEIEPGGRARLPGRSDRS